MVAAVISGGVQAGGSELSIWYSKGTGKTKFVNGGRGDAPRVARSKIITGGCPVNAGKDAAAMGVDGSEGGGRSVIWFRDKGQITPENRENAIVDEQANEFNLHSVLIFTPFFVDNYYKSVRSHRRTFLHKLECRGY